MMISKSYYIILISVAVTLMSAFGCKKASLQPDEYMNYLDHPENGIKKTREIGGIKISVKYLPSDYLTYNETKDSTHMFSQSKRDSIKNTYGQSSTFLLTLGPSEGNSFDITRVNVNSMEEFQQRMMAMSFSMDQMVVMQIGDKKIVPSITQMEQLYGLRNKRDIVIVFDVNPEKLLKNDVAFIFKDELFYTGINKFTFKAEDINNIPDLKLK